MQPGDDERMIRRLLHKLIQRKPNLGPRSPHWPTVRKAHLLKYPKCAACAGMKCLEVHHLQPYHLAPHLELDPANLVTLCECPSHSCHFIFGHLQEWHSYN